MSDYEYRLLGKRWADYAPYKLGSTLEEQYRDKLVTYYQRFDNHMPIPIRKELLRELERK